ncbi:MAG: alpha-amylase family glycosyl hydrolase [candidate division KSB1 bacterium]|nr:alpha-amylase family glycosyl hydrolase [candidate division KSB1 bacterium]MDZ7273861.1 alpha-amylase family glycosyl hydrolase [candidate division KSB1 bacterium]MDZ7286017.1 alpha-amylase family glycosyl hydrolase [candidate division KSB1 bacterium]MDZ7299049.1 alpha-amylase family glycosyl hydrolase [candidate division KSB1 bacterium]MDZ7308815.1 alpha-amylase family glycosyl hydrolase [candidate division KSB1 bacterium]
MLRKIFGCSTCLIAVFMVHGHLSAQAAFTSAERLQGYRAHGDEVIFIFDETVYGVRPVRVEVTGEMRGWSQDMADPEWALRREQSDTTLWTLAVSRTTVSKLTPGMQFKFRIDEGEWLPVPAAAPNKKSGNLVFKPGEKRLHVTAELVNPHYVRLLLSGSKDEPSLKEADYRLLRADGMVIPVAAVLRVGPEELHLHVQTALDLARVHYVDVVKLGQKVVASFTGYFRHLYSSEKLGAFYDDATRQTIFRVFAPRATLVKLYLYATPTSEAEQILEMKKNDLGVWQASVPGNLVGKYYDFTVHGPSDPGNYFFEQRPVHVNDPYARANVDAQGRSRVCAPVTPPPPLPKGRPKMADLIAYEVHVQDFTTGLTGLAENKRGTFAGMVEPNLRNARGEKIGFDHLVELGINAVHLLPVQEFMHYPDEEWQEAFANDPYMIERGINRENYQWGYRISNFFALENRYRIKGTDHGAQNEQFRDMVAAFHKKDIAVILDFVFNHTAENIDGRDFVFNFKAFDAQYYYRSDEQLRLIGVFGNETKSEDRPMVQRWIIEQCKFFVEEYGVDGFRIDLAGLTDKQTLLALRQTLGPDIILYGEPWIDSSDPHFQANPAWDWYKNDAPITYFDDDFRNAIHGPPDNPKNKFTDRGYAGGNGRRTEAQLAVAAGFETEHTPLSGINYLDIHDNWAMADRFARHDWDGRQGVEEGPFKIAAAMLFTSLGPVIIHGGTELMRSKGAAPLEEVVKHTRTGPIYLHGKRDTYNLRAANEFQWETKGKQRGDDNGQIKCNYDNMYKYWRGLIALRNSKYGQVCRVATKPADDYIKWFLPENERLLGYVIGERLLVLVNTDTVDAVFSGVELPPRSRWRLVADADRVDHASGIGGLPDSELLPLSAIDLTVPRQSVKIWVRD